MENAYYIIKENKQGKNEVVGIKNPKILGYYMHKHAGAMPRVPDGVQAISSNLLNDIPAISSIELPDSMDTINPEIFANHKDIKINYADLYKMSIYMTTPYGEMKPSIRLEGIENQAKFNTYLKTHIGIAPHVPEGVSYLWHGAFKNQKALRAFNSPESLVQVYWYAFEGCKNLKTFKPSSKLHYIGGETFSGCKSLKNFNIPKTTAHIKSRPFKDCDDNMVINVFNKHKIKKSEFELSSEMNGQYFGPTFTEKTLMNGKLSKDYKILQTGIGFYIMENEEINFISNEEILQTKNGEDIIKSDNAYNFYKFKQQLSKDSTEGERIYMPPAYVINNLPTNRIETYIKHSKIFSRILRQASASYENTEENQRGQQEGILSKDEEATLFKLSVLAGLYENDEKIHSSAIAFLSRTMLQNPKQPNPKSMALTPQQIHTVFHNISETPAYNEEFSTYCLHSPENFKKVYEASFENAEEGNSNFVEDMFKKFGNSLLMYEHSGKMEQSKGLMHDKWINYKKNSGKDMERLNFIDYVCQFGGQSGPDLGEVSEDLKPYAAEFGRYNIDIDSIERTADIIEQGKTVLPYAIFPNSNKIVKAHININVARQGLKPVMRHFDILRAHPTYKKDIEKDIDAMDAKFKVSLFPDIEGVVAKKGEDGITVASTSMKMATCARVNDSGCEELIESQLDKDVQPFYVTAVDEFGSKNVVATSRLEINREKGYAIFASLEVDRALRDISSEEDQTKVYFTLLETLNTFCNEYNKVNNIPLTHVSLGKTATVSINTIIEKYAPSLKYPLPADDRLTYKPTSRNSQFLIWDNNNMVKNQEMLDEPFTIDNRDLFYSFLKNADSLEISQIEARDAAYDSAIERLD